jgi:hypothetical protein
LNNTKPTENRGWIQVPRDGTQFLLYMWQRSITLVTNLVISHERGKNRIVITTNGTYPYTFIESIKHALTSSKSYSCILLSKKLNTNILVYHCFPVLSYCHNIDKHTIVDMCYSKWNYQYIAHLRLRDIAQRNWIYQNKSRKVYIDIPSNEINMSILYILSVNQKHGI